MLPNIRNKKTVIVLKKKAIGKYPVNVELDIPTLGSISILLRILNTNLSIE